LKYPLKPRESKGKAHLCQQGQTRGFPRWKSTIVSSASVIILPEVEAVAPALPPDIPTSDRSILVRHYRDLGSETREKISSPLSQFYSIGIGLRPTQFSAHINGKMIPDQRPHQGALYINEPSCALRTVFYKPAESVVLLVPVSLLIELGEECEEYHCPPDLLLRTIIAGQDRICILSPRP